MSIILFRYKQFASKIYNAISMYYIILFGNTAITEFFVLKSSLGHNTLNRDTVKNAIITNIIRV